MPRSLATPEKMMKTIILFISFFAIQSQAQGTSDTDLKFLTDSSNTSHREVIYFQENDSLPFVLEVTGVVTNISPGVRCGYLCTSGTVELKVSNVASKYNLPFLYVVVPCLADIDDFKMGKEISLVVQKLYKGRSECYFQNIINTIDSKGVAFYYHKSKSS